MFEYYTFHKCWKPRSKHSPRLFILFSVMDIEVNCEHWLELNASSICSIFLDFPVCEKQTIWGMWALSMLMANISNKESATYPRNLEIEPFCTNTGASSVKARTTSCSIFKQCTCVPSGHVHYDFICTWTSDIPCAASFLSIQIHL